jgi:hypothetical protein
VPLYVADVLKKPLGVSVAVNATGSYERLAGKTLPAGSLITIVLVVIVVGSIAWLKVTETVAAVPTPDAPAAGEVELTTGAGPSVRNDQVYVETKALPPWSFTTGPEVPPKTEAVYVMSELRAELGVSVAVKVVEL